MTTTIELKTAPELKRLVTAAFPGYKKHRAFLCVFGERGHNINSYWDGGSRSEYAIVELATMRRQSLPTASHPYFDVARNGLANAESDVISVDHVGNVTLKILPDGFALVEAGTFCGKQATACIYLPASNMPKYLTA
jgi:hypothetical protein